MIREYLLGQLSDEEQQRIEERLIADKDFFEQVMIEETELIDDYLAGALVERESFINHFLSTPQQLQKVRTAAALREYTSESAPEEVPSAAKHVRTPNSWFRRLLAGIQVHNVPRKAEAE
jgi:hypothetical protein